MKKILVLALFLIVAVSAASVSGQLPFRLQQNVFTGLSSPVFLTNARDGTRRIFIVQQRGLIRVAQPGSSTLTDYLNASGVVSQSGGERGLLGLAFHPQFSTNRRFFIYYTRPSDGAIEIAEYEQNATNPNTANPNPVRIIITIPHPTNSNHNGGTVLFGPDGYMYAGPGDGGSGNDPPNNAQNINTLLGKMIRLDINPPFDVPGRNYDIPPTNPYAGATPGADEIYAIGLRNPYRFSFDRGGTNQLWLADVGQNAIEEVDIITLGGNFGWRAYEGTQCTGLNPQECAGGTNPIPHIPPVFEYNRVSTPRCSITGGYVYRGGQSALPQGSYVYGDYCSGEILLWRNNQQVLQLDTSRNISSFGEDEDGEIYVVGLGGTIDKIVGVRTSADFGGDGATDLSVYRPSNGLWYSQSSSDSSVSITAFGSPADIPTPEDFDGDGRADIAVFRQTNGTWYFLRSSNGTVGIVTFGQMQDIPVAGDYDGDRLADLSVFRPSSGVWYSLRSTNGGATIVQFGLNNDIPVNGDYDGDGRDDIAVWRPSTGIWYYLRSSNGTINAFQFGASGQIPAHGDFDGDGRVDHAVFDPILPGWYIFQSSNSVTRNVSWGLGSDRPAVGDYDRDGRDDVTVWRPSNGTWYTIRSTDNTAFIRTFGSNGDLLLPSLDKP